MSVYEALYLISLCYIAVDATEEQFSYQRYCCTEFLVHFISGSVSLIFLKVL
jgi:hypothetical protein